MKTNATKAVILALIVATMSSFCTAKVTGDLTKAEIIKIYEKHHNKKIEKNDEDDFCVETPGSFKGVYALGWFANDRGCMGNEILVGDKIGTLKEMSSRGLKLNGWSDEKQRAELALTWVEEIVLAWTSPMSKGNEDFEKKDTPTFEAPNCELKKDGYHILVWCSDPSGMQPERGYSQFEVIIDEDGNFMKRSRVNSFSVSMR